MYNDYMQNVFGVDYSPYCNTYDSIFRNTDFYNQTENYNQYNYDLNYMQPNFSARTMVTDIEELYPEIYKIIYPMVKKICMNNSRHLSSETLDDMTDEIYNNIEANNIINLNINIESNKNENNSSNRKNINNENREERQFNNPIRDLIKILLVRELFDNDRHNRPPRPFPPDHFHPRPPRPPIRKSWNIST